MNSSPQLREEALGIYMYTHHPYASTPSYLHPVHLCTCAHGPQVPSLS